MRSVARWSVGLISLILVISAALGAVCLHQRSAADHAAGKRAQLQQAGERLHDIRTILRGSTLPPDRNTCAWYAHISETAFGYRYPRRASSDWNYVMSVCAGNGGH